VAGEAPTASKSAAPVENFVQLRDLALRNPLVQRAEAVLGAKLLDVTRAQRPAQAARVESERDES
jgi:hypothetical protein